MVASLVTTASVDAINNISKLDEQKQQQAVIPHQQINHFLYRPTILNQQYQELIQRLVILGCIHQNQFFGIPC